MTKQVKGITSTELNAALADIETEQQAWFAAQRKENATKSKREARQKVAKLALICRIGEYLQNQLRVC